MRLLETCTNLQYLEDLKKYFQPNLENIRSIHIIRIFLYTSADIPTSSTLLALLKLRTDKGVCVGGGGVLQCNDCSLSIMIYHLRAAFALYQMI